MGGGRTQWANFFNACFLLVVPVPRPRPDQHGPDDGARFHPGLHRLQAVPAQGVAEGRGRREEQLFVFAVTVLVTVTTDLLIGIAAGIALELMMSMWTWASGTR